MRERLLEKVLDTDAIGSMKSTCRSCGKRFFCNRLEQKIEKLREQDFFVWDLEYRLRFRNLLQSLTALGYEFPKGLSRCELSEQSKVEVNALLLEAQRLLLEINAGANEEI